MNECKCDENGLCDSCWRKTYAERPLGSRAVESGAPHAWDEWDERSERQRMNHFPRETQRRDRS